MNDKKHVLMIDDEKGLVEFVRSLLISKGYRFSFAYNGQEGIKKLSEGDPDLLLLDMSMPKMGGMQVFSQICSKYGRTRYPVIVLTALEELTEFFEDALVDAFMSKPFQVNELLGKIETLLKAESIPVVWLVEEDNEESEELADVLAGERFRVERVLDVEKAAQARAHAPDFILVEYSCCGHAGDETVKKIRKQAALKDTPVLVFSRTGLEDVEPAVLKAGADRYLGKPEDPKMFFNAMRQTRRKNRAGTRGER